MKFVTAFSVVFLILVLVSGDYMLCNLYFVLSHSVISQRLRVGEEGVVVEVVEVEAEGEEEGVDPEEEGVVVVDQEVGVDPEVVVVAMVDYGGRVFPCGHLVSYWEESV